MESLPYEFWKFLTIGIGALSVPLATYVGFLFGERNYKRAIFWLLIQILVVFGDSVVWFKSMEMIK
jgi:hypothetical protein